MNDEQSEGICHDPFAEPAHPEPLRITAQKIKHADVRKMASLMPLHGRVRVHFTFEGETAVYYGSITEKVGRNVTVCYDQAVCDSCEGRCSMEPVTVTLPYPGVVYYDISEDEGLDSLCCCGVNVEGDSPITSETDFDALNQLAHASVEPGIPMEPSRVRRIA